MSGRPEITPVTAAASPPLARDRRSWLGLLQPSPVGEPARFFGREGAGQVHPTGYPRSITTRWTAGHRHNDGMNAKELDSCDGCGYDAAEWTDRDSINRIALMSEFVRLWSEPTDPTDRNTRPRPEIWSIAEYVDHIRETMFGMRFIVELALDDPGRSLGPEIEAGPPGEHRHTDFGQVLERLGSETTQLAATLRKIRADQWDAGVTIGDRSHTVRWASRHAVHAAWHHLIDIASIAVSLGAGGEPQVGTVEQISRSSGGVPKTSVPEAHVSRSGMEGDSQKARAHHGRPWQALCLWSSDVITALADEGHPIFPGAAGENITLGGLDWAALHAGAIVEIGQMRAQLSAPAVPCTKNNRWFADGDSRRIDHDPHRGWSRWYASVIRPGRIQGGDAATIVSPSTAPFRRA